MGPSAALTPAIWDKTIPYDGENFHLEYMDLEEFLMENGISNLPDEDSLKGSPGKTEGKADKADVAKAPSVPTVALLPIDQLDNSRKEVVIITKSDSDIICDVTTGENRDLRANFITLAKAKLWSLSETMKIALRKEKKIHIYVQSSC